MTYELYTIAGAPRPWRAALALVAKGIDYTPRVLEASRKEHKAAAFLALNTRGRTPVLVHGDLVLSESLAIIAYLERAHPEPPLLGTSASETGRIWEQIGQVDHDLRAAASAVNGPIFKGADAGVESVREGAQQLLTELRRLDDRLARSEYLCGARITAADCVAFPEVRITLRAEQRAPEVMATLGLAPLSSTVPRLRAWIDRIEALPGYERTFPAHWR